LDGIARSSVSCSAGREQVGQAGEKYRVLAGTAADDGFLAKNSGIP